MSSADTERADLMAVVSGFADRAIAEATTVDLSLASGTPLPGLGHDLTEAEVPQPLAWSFDVVEAVSRRSPSWGYVLASRYAAQLSFPELAAEVEDVHVAAGERRDGLVVVPAAASAAGRATSLVAIVDGEAVRVIDPLESREERVGLAGAGLTRVEGEVGDLVTGTSIPVSQIWPVLLGAVAVGTGASLVARSAEYAESRQQFGAAIASFAGLRAMVSRVASDVERSHAQLVAFAQYPGRTGLVEAVAHATDVALSAAVDAVQTFGGYGYIDEYPITGMFRDAISLRARAGAAEIAWRDTAAHTFTTVEVRR